MTRANHAPTPGMPVDWDHCDAAGHYISSDEYQLVDSMGHPLAHGDVIYVACKWLVNKSMQPAQIIDGGGDRPIRVKLLREAARQRHIPAKRLYENGTIHISNGNMAYLTDAYRGIDPDLTAALLYPDTVPA